MAYRLSPSDFSFLYEGCKRCFYLKVARKISQPSIPLPAVFSTIASLLKDHYTGKHTSEVHPALPPGVVKYGEQRVQSEPIHVPGHDEPCVINGRFDIVADFDDGTYGVIDFKTGSPKEQYANLYGRQLHAYAYALEHPARGALHLSPVTQLGLLYFYPSRINQQRIEGLSYEADISWIAIKKDEEKFLRFIGEVLAVLESPRPPAPAPDCMWCAYVDKLGNKK
ncbi:MAG: PD-(D/E)XK nuclease family protein [Deltaproteobacteria bacterium]|nr:PD-(D/E)XK nuclease family protein [Deltaproteobacteria bacterium]